MKTAIVAGLLLAVPLVSLAPTASAFDWCVESVPGKDCRSHLVCVGRSTSNYGQYESCQYGVKKPCTASYCMPPPPRGPDVPDRCDLLANMLCDWPALP